MSLEAISRLAGAARRLGLIGEGLEGTAVIEALRRGLASATQLARLRALGVSPPSLDRIDRFVRNPADVGPEALAVILAEAEPGTPPPLPFSGFSLDPTHDPRDLAPTPSLFQVYGQIEHLPPAGFGIVGGSGTGKTSLLFYAAHLLRARGLPHLFHILTKYDPVPEFRQTGGVVLLDEAAPGNLSVDSLTRLREAGVRVVYATHPSVLQARDPLATALKGLGPVVWVLPSIDDVALQLHSTGRGSIDRDATRAVALFAFQKGLLNHREAALFAQALWRFSGKTRVTYAVFQDYTRPERWVAEVKETVSRRTGRILTDEEAVRFAREAILSITPGSLDRLTMDDLFRFWASRLPRA